MKITPFRYVLLERSSPKSVLVLSSLGIQIWEEQERLKFNHKKCSFCGVDTKGRHSYKPMLGKTLINKRDRICSDCIDQTMPILVTVGEYHETK